jgi:hypothetical protein
MHNISKKIIRDLANQLAATSDQTDSFESLEKTRELYERATLLHYNASKKVTEEVFEEVSAPKITDEAKEDIEKELTVQERIRQIMDTAPKFDIKKPVDKPKDETKSIEKPNLAEQETVNTPKKDLEEEFKDAIAADYAADLFERAEKIEITKKSLNDKLSQAQIQIGLNDRIAFVKHLFKGNQADFNRVLSQLNSFQTQDQASQFIENMVKPDYDWSEKTEYVERFMLLVERKFL